MSSFYVFENNIEQLKVPLGKSMKHFPDESDEYLSKNFSDMKLSGEEISSKEFDGCTFKDCDFSETIFKKCKFIDCDFVRCNLSLADMGYSRFSDVTFSECKLVGVDWTKASWPGLAMYSPLKFNQCIINDSSFFGLSLEEIVIEECKAKHVDFREGNFSEANFTYTDFSCSLFNRTNLTGADFTEATDYDIDIFHNEIKRAKFCRGEAMRLLDYLEIEWVD